MVDSTYDLPLPENWQEAPGLSGYEIQRARRIVNELAARQMEALRLYEPMPSQLEFHKSNAPERVVRGGNRSGKTACAACEAVWAITGTHPYLTYPKKMRMYVVGKDERQIGEVLWPKLRDPHESIKIIRDETTDRWRAWRPWLPSDLERESEVEFGPPLLPDRFIVKNGITWYKKKAGIPRIVRLTNGSKIYFMTAAGNPPQGARIGACWFDEEVGSSSGSAAGAWYREISMRLVDLGGKFWWSATPQAGTQELWDLHCRAEEQENKPEPLVTEHVLVSENNSFISEKNKRIAKAKLTDPNEYRIRWQGEFAISGFHIYPEFNTDIHGVEPFDIPRNWTRYMVVDPGYARCACLFAAVPPPTDMNPEPARWPDGRPVPFGDHVYLYDEIYQENCTSDKFAELMENRVKDYVFWEFIMDAHGGRMTSMSGNDSAMNQYSAALKAKGISSVNSGYGFIPSEDGHAGRVRDGILAVHEWLHVRSSDGTPKLRVFRGRLQNFEHEMSRYRKKRNTDGTYNEYPAGGRKFHLVDALRYLRQRNPRWHKAPQVAKKLGRAYKQFLEWKARRKRKNQEQSYINLGPGEGSTALVP